MTRAETGRGVLGDLTPWPWTVNMEGAGHWFDSRDAALSYVYAEFGRGARSFDIGCFQINYRWHGEAFRSIDHMLDPVSNATYAAKFLSDLHEETGNWSIAAGTYHSRTAEYANAYRDRFDRIHARLAETTTRLQRGAKQAKSHSLLEDSTVSVRSRALGSSVPKGGVAGSVFGDKRSAFIGL
ncbi:transglycosylase SLT domain-containing protein [uncultured Roseovarius sp.]|uniref:transglycosylase SLT domain-containing protein n=1 Tax=uncultured Roseovarius sp. TaxID=293344 RepID=UPI0034217F87